MGTWIEKMHQRPLIRTQSGKAAHCTDFNDRLHDELELLDVRNPDFSKAGDAPAPQRARRSPRGRPPRDGRPPPHVAQWLLQEPAQVPGHEPSL